MIEGATLLAEAGAAGADIETIFLDPAAARPEEVALARACQSAGARLFELQPDVLARACDTVTPQPVAAIVGAVDMDLAELETCRPDLLVICVALRDPGNLGTIIRAAGAAGAGGVVCCGDSVDLFNPKTVRSSAGMLFHVPVVAAGHPQDVLEEVGRWGLQRWGTAARTGRDYADADLTRPAALVLGNEAHGLCGSLDAHLDGMLRIPMVGSAESLNVATAASVLCFEAARQRRSAGS